MIGFDKCELEPNVLCDMDRNCLECVKRENAWAEAWMHGPEETEAEREETKAAPITVELMRRQD